MRRMKFAFSALTLWVLVWLSVEGPGTTAQFPTLISDPY